MDTSFTHKGEVMVETGMHIAILALMDTQFTRRDEILGFMSEM